MPARLPRREPLIDALKLLASQLIVLHHLAFYGPMADHAAPLLPGVREFLAGPARYVVQVFLVVGGFLAARQLAPSGRWVAGVELGPRLLERYLRLVVPLVFTLLLAMAAAALARQGMPGHPSVPDAPDALQLLAHLLLAQDLLGIDALSAGVWYVAIDFQLFAGLLLLLWAARRFEPSAYPDRPGRLAPWLVVGCVGVSALGINRDPDWDIAAPYFAAAYGLGVLAAWARQLPLAWWVGLLLVGLGMLVEPRERLLLATGVACLLWLVYRWRAAVVASVAVEPAWRGWLAMAGASSYAVFLLHFPVALVVNAAFVQWVPVRPWPQALGVVLAWALSCWAGWVFHRQVELPGVRWTARRLGLGR